MKHSEILKKIREENLNISQQKLADLTGIKKSTIGSIEADIQKTMPYEVAKKLSDKFGYDADKLLQGELIKTQKSDSEIDPKKKEILGLFSEVLKGDTDSAQILKDMVDLELRKAIKNKPQ